MSLDLARVIIEQLGGRRFSGMVGVKRYIWEKETNSIFFKIMRNCGKVDYVRVSYCFGSDTYTMRFLKMVKKTIHLELVAEYNDVHCSELEEVFEHVTGLKTRL